MQQIVHLLSTLPNFIAYLGTALAITGLFLALYTLATPHAEWKLLREGNASAALALSGALTGFALPLVSAIAHSISLLDMIVWGAVALVVQLLAFFCARILLPDLSKQIEANKISAAIFAAVFFLVVGMLNAACMVW